MATRGEYTTAATHVAAVPVARRISWGAVFAGVTLAVMTQILLSVLGLGVGMTAIDPMAQDVVGKGIGIGAAIWWFVSSLIAFFIGGWAAGRLAGIPRVSESALHGILCWSFATILTLFLVTTAVGKVIGGALGLVGQGIGGVTRTVAGGVGQGGGGGALEGFDWSQIQQQFRGMMRGEQGAAGGNFEQVRAAMERFFGGGSRDEAVNLLSSQAGIPRAEAERRLDEWQRNYEAKKAELELKARTMGDAAASSLAKGSIVAFVGLLFGALAAGIGGLMATPRELHAPSLD